MVRAMTEHDLAALIEVQEEGAVLGMAEVFPQDTHPFPRAAILDRWRDEMGDPTINTFVAVDDDDARLVGFAATNGSELLHFGTAVDTWGTGTATVLHDVVVGWLRAGGEDPVLHVFAGNRRARRFYDKHGWRPTGARRVSQFPPHPVLLEYRLPGP
jgi:RimJ/RimL family protein N-acetyltransferase